VLPEEARAAIARDLRALRQESGLDVAESFRLTTLEARFNVIGERFGRLLRGREEGRSPVPRAAAAPAAPRHDPAAGVVLDRRLDASAVEALFAGLASGGATRLDLDSFRGYLAQQLEAIRAKTGSEAVQFRVAEEDGKLKLKAKPVGPSG